MGPKTSQLISILERLEELLGNNEASDWATWASRSRRELLSSDFHGIERVLGAYGGMGSFSDLVLPTGISANQSLDLLRREAYELAEQIRRAQ